MQKFIGGIGCFWDETKYKGISGIISTECGYCGGKKAKTTYKEVCGGNTEHVEVVKVEFDEKIIAYEEVVKLFELLSVDKPDLESVVGLLNGPALNTPYGKACLSHGNDNDKVKVTDGEFDIGSAKPTQSNIWFFKSVLFSVSDTKFKTSVGSLTNTAKKSPALKVNYAEMNGTPYIASTILIITVSIFPPA